MQILLFVLFLMFYPSRLLGKGFRIYRSDSGGPYFGGHGFVSEGYVLAQEGMGKVCNVPEGMGKVFSISHGTPAVCSNKLFTAIRRHNL